MAMFRCGGIKTKNTVELVSIGSMRQTGAKTFDVSNINGFQNFNTGNFILNITGGTTGTGTSSGWKDTNACTGTVTITKSYNSNTGILTVTAKMNASTNSGIGTEQGLPIDVYVKYRK